MGEEADQREYNQRWFGYFGLLVFSLANFASVVDAKTFQGAGERAFSIAIGALSTTICALVLLFDRVNRLAEICDFKEIKDGKLEGHTLLFLVVWWVVGTALMTRADGIAYKSLNVYFSCWFSLGMSAYTLNEWSAAKDILSFEELTHLSATLKSWYALFLSSLVTMGSAAQVHGISEYDDRVDASFAVACGAISWLISMTAILMHYKIIRCCNIKAGGMVELTTALLLCLWWMIGVATITKDGGVAATITGTSDCDVEGDASRAPGSNLFLSSWTAFLSSLSITVRWKAAQALRFAQAQETQRRKAEKEEAGEESKTEPDDV